MLFTELGVSLPTQQVIYYDNFDAMNLCANPVFHSRMKYMALDYHFIPEQVQSSILRVAHVSSTNQLTDALMKPLPRQQFQLLKTKIRLSSQPSILRGHDNDN